MGNPSSALKDWLGRDSDGCGMIRGGKKKNKGPTKLGLSTGRSVKYSQGETELQARNTKLFQRVILGL